MAFTLLSKPTRRAGKGHKCIWCPEPINPGELYVDESVVSDGEFQNHKYHPECKTACNLLASEEGGEILIDPHACKRGTTEHV